MKLFNEDGNFIGEFIEASGEAVDNVVDNTKEFVSDAFSASIFLGLLGLAISPVWTIIAIIGVLVFKSIMFALKFIFNVCWWIFKLPFCLVFKRRVPEF